MVYPGCTSLYSPPISASTPSRKPDLSSSKEQQAVPGCPADRGSCEESPDFSVMGHHNGHAAQLGKETSAALSLTASQRRLVSLILMPLDPLGRLSLVGTLGVPKKQSKGKKEAAGKAPGGIVQPETQRGSFLPNLSLHV